MRIEELFSCRVSFYQEVMWSFTVQWLPVFFYLYSIWLVEGVRFSSLFFFSKSGLMTFGVCFLSFLLTGSELGSQVQTTMYIFMFSSDS